MLNTPVRAEQQKYFWVLLIAMCAVILSALAFEHIGGYTPCKLCLGQRLPWYLGIPLAALGCISVYMKWPAMVSRGLMFCVALLLVYSIYLGIHHAGVEWRFWEGPSDCGAVDGGLSGNANDLLSSLNDISAPSCTDASLRVLGLSFAGWNALVSILLAGLAFKLTFGK